MLNNPNNHLFQDMANFLENGEKYNKGSIFETFSFYDLKKPDHPDFYPVLERLAGEL